MSGKRNRRSWYPQLRTPSRRCRRCSAGDGVFGLACAGPCVGRRCDPGVRMSGSQPWPCAEAGALAIRPAHRPRHRAATAAHTLNLAIARASLTAQAPRISRNRDMSAADRHPPKTGPEPRVHTDEPVCLTARPAMVKQRTGPNLDRMAVTPEKAQGSTVTSDRRPADASAGPEPGATTFPAVPQTAAPAPRPRKPSRPAATHPHHRQHPGTR